MYVYIYIYTYIEKYTQVVNLVNYNGSSK